MKCYLQSIRKCHSGRVFIVLELPVTNQFLNLSPVTIQTVMKSTNYEYIHTKLPSFPPVSHEFQLQVIPSTKGRYPPTDPSAPHPRETVRAFLAKQGFPVPLLHVLYRLAACLLRYNNYF